MLTAEECLAKSRELNECAAAADASDYHKQAEYWRLLAALAAWQESFVGSNAPTRFN
jgi:hypothetical protein